MRASFLLLALVPFLGASASAVNWTSASADSDIAGIHPSSAILKFTPTGLTTGGIITACSAIFVNTVVADASPVVVTGTGLTGCTTSSDVNASRCLTVTLAGCTGTSTAEVTVNITNRTVFDMNPPAGTNVTFAVTTSLDSDSVIGFGWTSRAADPSPSPGTTVNNQTPSPSRKPSSAEGVTPMLTLVLTSVAAWVLAI